MLPAYCVVLLKMRCHRQASRFSWLILYYQIMSKCETQLDDVYQYHYYLYYAAKMPIQSYHDYAISEAPRMPIFDGNIMLHFIDAGTTPRIIIIISHYYWVVAWVIMLAPDNLIPQSASLMPSSRHHTAIDYKYQSARRHASVAGQSANIIRPSIGETS